MNLKSLFSLCNATGEKEKGQKEIRDRERYVSTSLTDLLLAPSIEFFGQSNITIPLGP